MNNETPEAPKPVKMPPFSGGWRKDYATLAQQFGYEVRPCGSCMSVRKEGHYLGLIEITRDLQFPDALRILEQRKVAAIAKDRRDRAEARLRREAEINAMPAAEASQARSADRVRRVSRPYGLGTMGMALAVASMAAPLFGSGRPVRPWDPKDLK